ncbi:MAG: uracil phosphoribosyltransferase [Eubacteriales bacterium]|jgi:uracil phosphoribosyltransferase|nr:uracil phosphoribosyltransferase [Eubacteriales bacterium]
MSEFFVSNHPLIQNKMAMLRNKNTCTKEFKEIISEVAMLLCYEATRNIELVPSRVETPITSADVKVIDKRFAVVPILRAGMGMLDGLLTLMPTAKVGVIGLYRDPETLKPVEYYCKLPKEISDMEVFVTDPMLATGGTAVAAIDFIKEKGAKKITFLCILAAPEGVKKLQEAHPDVDIYAAAYDECLNDHGYIVPGLGDAGDRIFGTK